MNMDMHKAIKKAVNKSLKSRYYRFALALGAVVLVGQGFAQTVTSRFVFSSSDGVIIGTGELEGGTLELKLLEGYSGFAQLLVTDADGEAVAYEVMIGADGSVTVVSDGGFVMIGDLPALVGSTVEIDYKSELGSKERSDLTGLDRAREVTVGNENAQKGLDNAEAAKGARGKGADKKDGDSKDGDEADVQDGDTDQSTDETSSDDTGSDDTDSGNTSSDDTDSGDTGSTGAGNSGDHGGKGKSGKN